MSRLLAHLQRAWLWYRLQCLQAELQAEREELDRSASRMAELRRSIELGKQELAIVGSFRPSSYQLGGR